MTLAFKIWVTMGDEVGAEALIGGLVRSGIVVMPMTSAPVIRGTVAVCALMLTMEKTPQEKQPLQHWMLARVEAILKDRRIPWYSIVVIHPGSQTGMLSAHSVSNIHVPPQAPNAVSALDRVDAELNAPSDK